MKDSINYLIISAIACLTILMSIAMLCNLSLEIHLTETPYEQCLNTCSSENTLANHECSKICTQEFSALIINLSDRLIPVIEKYISSQDQTAEWNLYQEKENIGKIKVEKLQ